MRNLRPRAWDIKEQKMVTVFQLSWDQFGEGVLDVSAGGHYHDKAEGRYIVELPTGLKDKNGVEYYHHDIGRFPNGDIFVIRMEEWLEIYVDWVGEPECEDQARDLYRISDAEIIGNIHENPELL